MPELPTGTVTFLFSDIEKSTRLATEHADAWPAILERHRVLLRAAFEAAGGVEAGTEGDSFFVVFPGAPDAVAAAVEAQRALAAEPWAADTEVRVRMGMHTGEASFSAKTYAGLNVHRASRVASVAHGGQVLLSDATRALVEGALPRGRVAARPRRAPAQGPRSARAPVAAGDRWAPGHLPGDRHGGERRRTTCRRG